MNKKEFQVIVNFYLIIKHYNSRSNEYKDCIKVLKHSSPYTCNNCKNNVGLSMIESKHNCNNPMFNNRHIPIESYLKEECVKQGYIWDKIEKHFIMNCI